MTQETRFPLSSALIVSGDTSIGACAEQMKSCGVSAVLISSREGKLEGIFTDRDLFLKLNAPGETGAFWEKPVSTAASRPVYSIDPSLMHLAPELMATHGIRHVPVVSRPAKPGDSPKIHGILTMDAILREEMRSALAERAMGPAVGSSPAPRYHTFGVLCDDRAFSYRLVSALERKQGTIARAIRRAEISSPDKTLVMGDSFSNLVLDADGLDSRKLAKTLHLILGDEGPRRIVLLFTPQKADPTLSFLMHKLKESDRFEILEKPLDPETLAGSLNA